MSLTTIHTEHANRNQSLTLTHIAKRSDNKRFRVRIARNAYDHQSLAIAETWTPSGWTEVIRRDIAALKVSAFNYTTRDPAWQDAALKDAEALLTLADAIVL